MKTERRSGRRGKNFDRTFSRQGGEDASSLGKTWKAWEEGKKEQRYAHGHARTPVPCLNWDTDGGHEPQNAVLAKPGGIPLQKSLALVCAYSTSFLFRLLPYGKTLGIDEVRCGRVEPRRG